MNTSLQVEYNIGRLTTLFEQFNFAKINRYINRQYTGGIGKAPSVVQVRSMYPVLFCSSLFM